MDYINLAENMGIGTIINKNYLQQVIYTATRSRLMYHTLSASLHQMQMYLR